MNQRNKSNEAGLHRRHRLAERRSISRMLKKSASGVLASLRGSTY
jgi:hypothetical protein